MAKSKETRGVTVRGGVEFFATSPPTIVKPSEKKTTSPPTPTEPETPTAADPQLEKDNPPIITDT